MSFSVVIDAATIRTVGS